jgi:hypothetical protein
MYPCFAFIYSVKDTQDAIDVSRHLMTCPWTYLSTCLDTSWDMSLRPNHQLVSRQSQDVLRHVLRPNHHMVSRRLETRLETSWDQIIIWSQDSLKTSWDQQPKGLKYVSRRLETKSKTVSRQSQDCLNTISRQSQDSLETVLRQSWDSLEVSWDSLETVLRQSWDCLETYWKIFNTYLRLGLKTMSQDPRFHSVWSSLCVWLVA